ncbi:MAG: type II/IV secretion system ATPase subunit [Candidatus Thermoplasmatota archaeon]|nr:type II/IV secretion system ATPase subunit [Candidatus Thermoplasmatota archaeon]
MFRRKTKHLSDNSEIVESNPGQKIKIKNSKYNEEDMADSTKEEVPSEKTDLEEIDFYPLNEPYAHARILKDTDSLDKYYRVEEPTLKKDESEILNFIQETLIRTIDVRLDQLESDVVDEFLVKNVDQVIKDHKMKIDSTLKGKILYYIARKFIGYGRLDPLMRDPNIEDISCDGSDVPIFLFHRIHGSLKSNVKFDDEDELSNFVVQLAQKCDKYISIAEPMLDATMPDGSRIQMTLSTEITTKGSTFTIRKFRDDPITPVDLIDYNTMSAEIIAYMWMAVENGISALFAGGTASGKTSTLNALCLFIPYESKIVSIEETREVNLPHPNWIPGVSRSGFGEVVGGKIVGEIDLYDLMKAALRQRPEYILVGEIRGKEAYVLFQAMATGHTTYSTFHADSAKSLVHRLESKPIDIPRVMLQSLDLVSIQISTRVGNKHVRRCKQIMEIIDIDPTTKEILTNEAFHWDPVEDKFVYSGKSYILERLSSMMGISKKEMKEELSRRTELLYWMRENKIRAFEDVAGLVASYVESPDELMEKIRAGTTGREIIGIGKIDGQKKFGETNEVNESSVKENRKKSRILS